MATRYPPSYTWHLEAKLKMLFQTVPPDNLNRFNSF
jgi:hypothetical protein